MLTDAHAVPAGTALTADICVIGAGAAGITLAKSLDGSGVSILLLESGGFDYDAATQALYDGKIIGLPIDPTVKLGLDNPRLRYFGGTTNHWAGYCRPIPDLDFQARAWIPHSGWPFGRADLDPFYARAQDIIGLGPYQYTLDYWRSQGLIAQPLLENPATPHTIIQITDAPRFGPVYRNEIVSSPNVQLVIWANVTRLELTADNTGVQSVDVATLSGNTFSATAKVFVLATGGLEVPRLLLASNDRRPAGVGNENDLVGRCFMEHVNIAAGTALLAASAAAVVPYTPTPQNVVVGATTGDDGIPVPITRGIDLQAVITLPPDTITAQALHSCEFTFEFPFAPGDKRLEQLYPGTSAGIDLMTAQAVDPGIAVTVRVLCEQEPNLASRVRLTSVKDPLGMPRISLDWRLTRDDRTSMLQSLRILGQQIGQRGLGRLRVDIDGFVDADPTTDVVLDYPVNTGSHHIGTARMAASPLQGVVDPDCKVHSVNNLYIAGSAVFPTSGANTPTMTIVALALRLADHLRTVVA
jgi:choline dehydrogenase-like flavoprotein